MDALQLLEDDHETPSREDEEMPDGTNAPHEMPSIDEDPTELPQEQPAEQPGESVETPDPDEVERPGGRDDGAITTEGRRPRARVQRVATTHVGSSRLG